MAFPRLAPAMITLVTRGEPGPEQQALLARGVGVYTEIDRRAVQIPLMRAPEAGEQLEITFTDDDTSPGRVLAQRAVPAP